MKRNVGLLHFAWVGARAVQEGAPGAAGTVDDFLGEDLEVVGVVVFLLANNVDQATPAAADADDAVAFAQRADGDGADGRVQAGHVTAAGEDSDHAFLYVDVSHVLRLASEWSRNE